MEISLRGYQNDLVGKIRESMRVNRRVLAVAPTGAGKTVVFSYLSAAISNNRKRVTIAAHREEIIDHISDELGKFRIKHGFIKPGHSMTDDYVQIGMIGTIKNRIGKLITPDYFIVDEAHHMVASQYMTIANNWRNSRICGFTATPLRLDGKGLDEAFDDLVVGPETRWLIDSGYLADYDLYTPPVGADFSNLSVRAGDYKIDQLAEATDKAVITGNVIKHYETYLGGRTAIAFCATIAHAAHVAEQFRDEGFRSTHVDGSMDKRERKAKIAALGTGEIQVLTSCDLIDEGVDIPSVNGAILLRKTKSLVKYRQSIGRALRLKQDGSRAIFLDHVGNFDTHGFPDQPIEWKLKGNSKNDDKIKSSTCEACYKTFAHIGQWKKDPCTDRSGRTVTDCVMIRKERDGGGGRPAPENVDGHLAMADRSAMEEIRKKKLSEILTGKESFKELQEIGKIRGYHKNWAFMLMKSRRERHDRN